MAETTISLPPAAKPRHSVPLIVFLLLSVAIGAIGWSVYRTQIAAIKREKQNELAAIAKLKVRQITDWIAERRGNAEAIYHNRFIGKSVKVWFEEGAPNDETEEFLRSRIETLKQIYKYKSVVLLDPEGRIRMQAGVSAGTRYIREQGLRAIKSRKVITSDLHWKGTDGQRVLAFDVTAPLRAVEGDEAKIVGAVFFSTEPRDGLFPLLREWPLPSESGETVLVRREVDKLVYVSDLLHFEDADSALRLPLATRNLVGAMAVQGIEGVVEGNDYRGVPVLASLHRIRGTSWAMDVKVDQREVYAPLRRLALFSAVLTAFFIVGAATIIHLWWRGQHAGFLLEQYRSREKHRELGRRLAETLNSMTDGFLSLDKAWNYAYVNPKASELLGRHPEDLVGKNLWEEVPEAVSQLSHEAYKKAMDGGITSQVEDYHSTTDRWFEKRIYPSEDGIMIFIHEITDRKRMEARLRASDRYHRCLFEFSPIGLALCRMDGTLVDVNSAYAAIVGRSVAELQDMTYWELTPDDYFENERVQLENLKRAGRYGPYEKEYLHKDGHRVPVRLRGLILDKDGESHIWSSVEDITARKQAEQREQIRVRVLEQVARGAPLPEILESLVRGIEAERRTVSGSILLLDEEAGHFEFSVAPDLPDGYSEKILGLPIGPRAGSCGTAAFRRERVIVSDIENDPFWEDYRDLALQFGLRACWSQPILSSTGKVLGTFAMYYREVRSPSEEDLNIIGDFANIAGIAIEHDRARQALGQAYEKLEREEIKLKQTLEALKQSEIKYRTVFESSGDAIMLFDGKAITDCNDATLRVFGCRSRDEFLGTHPADWSPAIQPKDEDSRHAAQRHIRRAMRKGSERFEWVHRKRDGSEFATDVRLTAMALGNRKVLHATVRDISERKRAEAEIQALNAQLERRVMERTAELVARNEELKAFSYSVSHDLRAPLRAINGFSHILARSHGEHLDEEGRHFLDNIIQASDYMGRLIDDLLAYSRVGRDAIRRQSVSLDEVLRRAVRDLEPRIRESGSNVAIADDLPSVQGDPTLLRQVFTNLLDNAITYRAEAGENSVDVTWRADGDESVVCVQDNGIGIESQYQEKIFHMFQRLHSEDQYPGTGIGLAIVKKAVELMGGRVSIESSPGRGSRFFVRLPGAWP